MRVEVKIRGYNDNRIEAELEGSLPEIIEAVDNLLADMSKLEYAKRHNPEYRANPFLKPVYQEYRANPFLKPEYQESRECVSCRSHWFFHFKGELSGRIGCYPGIAYVFCANCGKPHPIQ